MEQFTDEIERKALEIILLNKKYESIDSESEEEKESEQHQSKENYQQNYLVLRPNNNNKIPGLINQSKPIKKRRNTYFYKYLSHMQMTKKENLNSNHYSKECNEDLSIEAE